MKNEFIPGGITAKDAESFSKAARSLFGKDDKANCLQIDGKIITPSDLLKEREYLCRASIVIIGNPGTGKTWLSAKVGEAFKMPVIHTDDYMQHGYKDALYCLLDDVVEMEGPFIVEGVQGYRLLRKGVELENFYPDVVIEVIAPDEQVRKVYEKERPGKDFDKVASFNKMHQTIFEAYENMENPYPPQWYTVENIFEI